MRIRVWLDEKFRKLSAAQPNAQTLWFYLLFRYQTGIDTGRLAIRNTGSKEISALSRCESFGEEVY